MGYWGVVVALKILGQENLLSQQFKGDRNLRERIPLQPLSPSSLSTTTSCGKGAMRGSRGVSWPLTGY